MKTKVIAVASLKGGVGKTALAASLVAFDGGLGVDLDPQGSMTDYLGRGMTPDQILARNTWHFLTERMSAVEVMVQANYGMLMPSAPALHTVGAEMSADPGAALRVRSALEESGAPYIVIDTAPYLSYELRAALYAADLVVVPVAQDRWGRIGLDLLLAESRKAARSRGRDLPVLAVPSLCTPREAEVLRESLPVQASLATWTRAAGVRRAMHTAARLKPDSQAAESIKTLFEEVMA